MKKEQFNLLLQDYSNLADQNKDLESLMMEYPYSQPVRLLNVKSSSKLSKKEYQRQISLAAFYTTDRTVLRSLIEKGKVPSDIGGRVVSPQKKKNEPLKKPIKSAKTLPTTGVKSQSPEEQISKRKSVDGDKLRDEVMANLELLQQTKSSFLKIANIDSTPVKKIKKTAADKPKVSKKTTPKKVAKPLITETSTKAVKGSKAPRTKKNELIDRFIADEPSITPGKAARENQSDLSKSSGELKEDLVSENLAIIYAEQGKENKAIEIYKKLIWKFPQKKASFAARIEELKKK